LGAAGDRKARLAGLPGEIDKEGDRRGWLTADAVEAEAQVGAFGEGGPEGQDILPAIAAAMAAGPRVID
jgi:hypothetical protein